MDSDPFIFLGFSLEQWLKIGRFAVLFIDKAAKWRRDATTKRSKKPKDDDPRNE